MSYEIHRHAQSFVAGATLPAGQPVRANPGVEHEVLPVSTATQVPVGVGLAAADLGRDVAVHTRGNVVKVYAGASIGHGALVGVVAATRAVVVAAGAGTYAVGRAQMNAQPGEIFSVFVDPERLAA